MYQIKICAREIGFISLNGSKIPNTVFGWGDFRGDGKYRGEN